MPPDGWNAERALVGAPVHPFHGRVWRVHWREVSPADWRLSLRTSGRYHRGLDRFPADQVFPALYTSLAPEIALWEMVRRSAARNLDYLRNTILSELEVSLDHTLDLADPATIGLARADLTGSEQRSCQELAAIAMFRAYGGLLVPSAALPGLNLVILPRNMIRPSSIRVLHSTNLLLEAMAKEHLEGGATRDRA